jgi:hypothetical protein
MWRAEYCIESRRTFASYDRNLRTLALLRKRHDRDHGAIRKIDMRDYLIGTVKDLSAREINMLEQWPQPRESSVGKRIQNIILGRELRNVVH